jgi:hypothetical protein
MYSHKHKILIHKLIGTMKSKISFTLYIFRKVIKKTAFSLLVLRLFPTVDIGIISVNIVLYLLSVRSIFLSSGNSR